MKTKIEAGILTAIPETLRDMEAIVKFVAASYSTPGRPKGVKNGEGKHPKAIKNLPCHFCDKMCKDTRGRGIHEKKMHRNRFLQLKNGHAKVEQEPALALINQ